MELTTVSSRVKFSGWNRSPLLHLYDATTLWTIPQARCPAPQARSHRNLIEHKRMHNTHSFHSRPLPLPRMPPGKTGPVGWKCSKTNSLQEAGTSAPMANVFMEHRSVQSIGCRSVVLFAAGMGRTENPNTHTVTHTHTHCKAQPPIG